MKTIVSNKEGLSNDWINYDCVRAWKQDNMFFCELKHTKEYIDREIENYIINENKKIQQAYDNKIEYLLKTFIDRLKHIMNNKYDKYCHYKTEKRRRKHKIIRKQNYIKKYKFLN
jgi:hypothetical protein